jgi:WD40 repeat protein
MVVDGYEKVLVYDIPEDGPPASEPSLELPSASSSFIRAAFSRDGKYLVVVSHDGVVQAWRTANWTRLGVWEVPKTRYSAGRPHGLVLTGEGRQAWVQTTEQLIALDYTSGTWGRSWDEIEGYTLAPRLGGSTMAVGQIDGAVLMVDPGTGAKMLRLEGHRELVEAADFLPDGRLVTGSEDGTVVIWRLSPEADLAGRGPDGPLARVQYPFATSVPRRGQDSPRLQVEDLGVDLHEQSTDGLGASFSPDGKLLASGYSGKLRLHHAGQASYFLELDRVTGQGRVTAWFPDSARVATLDKEFVRVYRLPEGKQVAAWPRSEGWFHHIVVFADGSRLARAGSREVVVHDTTSGEVVAEFEAMGRISAVSSSRLHALDASPDGTQLVTGGDDGTLRLWELPTGRLLAEARDAHHPAVRAARFLPGGGLVSTGQDGLVRWWGPGLAPGRSEEGHLGEGRNLAVHAGHGLVLSGGRDGAVIFWGLDGTKRLRLESKLEAIDYLAPSPTGEWLVVASEADGSLRLPLPLLVDQLSR